jgi:integrase
MAGSLRLVRGDDVWELRVYLGRDSRGRVRHLHRTFEGSRRAAERELARFVTAQEAEPAPVPEEPVRWGPTTTVNDAIGAWRDNGWEDLSPKTRRDYETTWNRYIAKSIGEQRIATLTTFEIERRLRELKRQGLGYDSVRHVRNMLNRACRLARKWSGGVLPNPVADSELPSWSIDQRGEVRAPELEEVQALLATADEDSFDPRIAACLRLLAATGMRRGEACALRWSDVDFEAGAVRIDESIVVASGGAEVKGPKTRASIRRAAIDRVTLERLTVLRAEQESLAAACEVEFVDDGFVFSFVPGGGVPPHPDAISKAFARVRDRAGVARDVHLHSLRHFHATVLDSVVSERQKQARLGWSTVRMARHYTDAIPAEDQRAAEHVGKLLAEPRKDLRTRG